MLWDGGRESGNVEDRRGMGGPIAVGGGIVGVIFFIIKMFLGGDPGDLQQQLPDGGNQQITQEQRDAQAPEVHFVKTVLAFTEDVWTDYFRNKLGKEYTDPKLVIFSGATQSGCGNASAATGPFYCPADQDVYIDLSFYDELRNRFGANGGDFAQAYVIAHEVGHHIQDLLGITDKVDRLRQQLSEEEYNKYSVRVELQADFFAGVWAHYMQDKTINGKPVLQKGDLEDALNAASAIGDDRLQKETQGYVTPESFTHGTSAERMYWLKKGFDTGDINQGDTFNATDLH